ADNQLTKRIMQTASDTIEDYVDEYTHELRKNSNAFAVLLDKIKKTFGLSLQLDNSTFANGKDEEKLIDEIVEKMRQDLQEKELLVGTENMNMFIRSLYIQAIDRKWLDHLETLETLRESVHLRSYGEKNPLTEYKIDGFNIFYNMLDEIRLDTASKVFRVKIQVAPEGEERRPREQHINMNAQHQSSGAFGGAQNGGSVMGSASQPENAQYVRTTPKVGRNDPCPCGSGKKYKHCCGR
ncbi:MAG: SEC-C domain-containing protein, partial [Spirochaetaceae bacterium]|nr:SEC-C domain-containing protein [Spirochaetaceae bacterium]